ncbi:predicted protein [Sclerotinia sclerotiorum 1980 UF-70]|uniref:Uncharacterized protein n=1 Tax=Sclerotinia sclerotiorum (strain ATCC 18683 / 1980 / Ss-1) TaxID=665079 RepID=A7F4E5_SCLS1|nr:predicted protein [Sclerotinia sclerotiorum 1980 UF-70]EDN97616.1 predicted protein [Sclerotinia sclerotiorum 1980 UF-70]
MLEVERWEEDGSLGRVETAGKGDTDALTKPKNPKGALEEEEAYKPYPGVFISIGSEMLRYGIYGYGLGLGDVQQKISGAH